MNSLTDPNALSARAADAARAEAVRADFVPASHYTSPDFLRREQERLWPRVWQVACREEELAEVGAFVTYDIMDDSIVVVRTETGLKAFHNVCPHRGRRLTSGCGQARRFHCRFHGWQFALDGAVTRVLDREDWSGCPEFADGDLSLTEVLVDTWAGWVFVNMDREAPPLADFLDPVPRHLDPYEIGKMRYRWYISVKVPCNWKVGLEAFDEGYHVAATHPQLLPTYGDDLTRSRACGPHGNFWVPFNPEYPMGAPSPRLGLPPPKDLRPKLVEHYNIFKQTLKAIFTDRAVEASQRLLTEVPAGTPPDQIMARVLQFQKEAAIATGAGWPDISTQQMVEAGTDWHVFPNLVMLPYPDGLLAYRSLPHPTDPNACFFEVYSLQRYAPGTEPPLERQYLHGDEDWRKIKDVSLILQQDFENMGEVQRGLRSRGFRGCRTNPVQEVAVSNFHRALAAFVEDAAPA
jgi:phenylpropionate dioxygenase-like ring-hydroxylating dioxygenase large terminal subunit